MTKATKIRCNVCGSGNLDILSSLFYGDKKAYHCMDCGSKVADI